MLEIPWNGVKMLLEIPWEGSKKMRFLNRGGADINWNSPIQASSYFLKIQSMNITHHLSSPSRYGLKT